MCDDCGINLKQRGYFFIEDNLYCETHAKARVQPPEGYDVVAVYPNSKVEIVWIRDEGGCNIRGGEGLLNILAYIYQVPVK